MTPLGFFDDAAISAEHDSLVAADDALRMHALAGNAALEVIVRLLEDPEPEAPEPRLLRLLAWRVLKAAGAALRLGRSGFFIGAFAQARDVLECTCLLDLFRRWPEEMGRWLRADEATRRRDFSPAAIRRRLDGADGFRDRRRDRAHRSLADQAAEASGGLQLAPPGTSLKLVPAADPRLLRALLQELRLRLSEATLHLLRLPLPQPVAARAAIVRFRQTIRELETAG